MSQILLGSLLLSVLHAIIPNHWLPVLAIGRRENWDMDKTTRVTLISGLAHVASTVAIGLVLALLGWQLQEGWERWMNLLSPAILILLGIFFIFQHYRHHHFHLHHPPQGNASGRIIPALVLSMLLSPCMEIEAYFLLAGTKGWWLVAFVVIMYASITVTGMVLWIRMAYRGLVKLNWHHLEHNAGIITGSVLLATGILSFFLH